MGSNPRGKIYVAGDVHLGAANADAEAFNGFLDGVLRESTDEDRVVLLGDVWDLVRRDPFGCAWETSETITRIKRLAEAVPVDVVLGNHDVWLSGLDDALYDVNFHGHHVVESGDDRIRFYHGQAFDGFHSDRLSAYLSGPGDRGDIDPTRGRKDPVVSKGREVLQRGKRHLRSTYATLRGATADDQVTYPRRERRAHAHLENIPEDKLVFGHTHSPYVRPDNAVANPGSWKSTAPIHNTYLVIEGGEIELFQYRPSGPDQPILAGELVDVSGATDSRHAVRGSGHVGLRAADDGGAG